MRTADALVGWEFPRHDFAARAPRLRWFHSIGAGINQYLPLDWLPPRVLFTNNRGVHGLRAAEYAITAVMMLKSWARVGTCSRPPTSARRAGINASTPPSRARPC